MDVNLQVLTSRRATINGEEVAISIELRQGQLTAGFSGIYTLNLYADPPTAMYNVSRFVQDHSNNDLSQFRRPGQCKNKYNREQLTDLYAQLRGVPKDRVWFKDTKRGFTVVSADMMKSIALWIYPQLEAYIMVILTDLEEAMRSMVQSCQRAPLSKLSQLCLDGIESRRAQDKCTKLEQEVERLKKELARAKMLGV